MSGVSDETLMAYVDGELALDQRRVVEQFVSAHPETARRLAVFEGTGRALGAMFDQAMPEKLPERLVSAVMAEAPVPVSNVIPLRRKAAPAPNRTTPSWAIAAGLALIAMGTALWLKQGVVSQYNGFDLASVVDQSGNVRDGLKTALETVASGADGKVAGLAEQVTVRPDFTFLAKSGAFCRQYNLTQGVAAVAGVACRGEDGVWHAERHVASVAPAAKTDGQIVPAGRETSKELETLVDGMISGDVLGADAESAAIKNGWRNPARQ